MPASVFGGMKLDSSRIICLGLRRLAQFSYNWGAGGYIDSALRRFLNTVLPPVSIARIISLIDTDGISGLTADRAARK